MKAPESRVRPPSALFAALGDATRLRIVVRLARGEPLSIKQLASGARMTRQAVTKHLHVLAAAGVATPSRQGREQLWALDRRQLAQARLFLDGVAQQWDVRLARLKASLEDPPR
ncbi:MAG TPA: metalloregulator ArsR/SmtB family transcription factor [Bryobacteraceae bacterium]|nr:metalloregulator ArsR/SmtB family transcription factor [Bryobacteraceae bacterium]